VSKELRWWLHTYETPLEQHGFPAGDRALIYSPTEADLTVFAIGLGNFDHVVSSDQEEHMDHGCHATGGE
jgi:hypothetical protein